MPKLTPDEEAEVIAAYVGGLSQEDCAERFGVSKWQIGKITKRIARKPGGRRDMKRPEIVRQANRLNTSHAERDWKRLAKAIPEDTRNFTQSFFGDPLPGRSALDKMKAQEAA